MDTLTISLMIYHNTLPDNKFGCGIPNVTQIMNINIQHLLHDMDEENFTKFKLRNTPENHLPELFVDDKIKELKFFATIYKFLFRFEQIRDMCEGHINRSCPWLNDYIEKSKQKSCTRIPATFEPSDLVTTTSQGYGGSDPSAWPWPWLPATSSIKEAT